MTFPTGEPFTLKLGSKKMIILTTNRDVATAWKDTRALTFDPFVQQLMTLLGMSKRTQNSLFREEPETFIHGEKRGESLLLKENPTHLAFYHLQMEWVKRQLSGNMLGDIGKDFLGVFDSLFNALKYAPFRTVSVTSRGGELRCFASNCYVADDSNN